MVYPGVAEAIARSSRAVSAFAVDVRRPRTHRAQPAAFGDAFEHLRGGAAQHQREGGDDRAGARTLGVAAHETAGRRRYSTSRAHKNAVHAVGVGFRQP